MAAESASSRQSSDSKQDGRSGQDSDKKEDNKPAHEEGQSRLLFDPKDVHALKRPHGAGPCGRRKLAETSNKSLKNYFSQFGEVTDCIVMRDPSTSRSRGFGFLTFVDPSVVNTVLVKEHHLDGKIDKPFGITHSPFNHTTGDYFINDFINIDPKRAIPREEQEKTEKIFVGGIAPEVSEEEFKEYFSQFGHVIDATLMVDRDSGRPRGFGFITFDSSEPVEKAMSRNDLEINNKQIEVKRAMPKHKSQRVQTMYSHQSYGSSSSTNASPGIMSSPTSSANSRYGSPYAVTGGTKDGNSSVGNYNPSSYPSYGGYGQYSGYNYPSSYPSGYAQYNAMTHAYYSSRYGNYSSQYGGSGYGSGRGGSYSQWYAREGGYGSGGPSSAGSASALGGPSSSSRMGGGYRHSPVHAVDLLGHLIQIQ
ncbi:1673_t:CDS:2 [Acaulospora morrowiae]|uniref:1673_t:CDS:1 n=1 Tax=Acaulospora morrowiae TaxID=94023 RepID=A0A9N8Z0V2_9GLOM|nr:1673_t:CDS:2 [Acaulospora morrowiae]